jgi:hypothetical protein
VSGGVGMDRIITEDMLWNNYELRGMYYKLHS